MLHVARHLLRTNQHAVDLRVSGGCEIRSAVGVRRQPRVLEQLQRRFLQTAFGNPDAHFHRASLATLASDSGCRTGKASVKQDRVPRWQTTPGPSTSTRSSNVSRSQSVYAESTRNRLPELSPFIHNFPRMRLKKVTYPFSIVCCIASRFMNPTIRISPSRLSCTTAGSSPSIFSKSSCVSIKPFFPGKQKAR